MLKSHSLIALALCLAACSDQDTGEAASGSTNSKGPKVDFEARFTLLGEGQEVAFQDKSAKEATDWFWEFGDGDTSTDQNPKHAYAEDGLFDVSLTINSASTLVREDYIEVRAVPDPAILVDDPDALDKGDGSYETQVTKVVTVEDDSEDGPILEWEWDVNGVPETTQDVDFQQNTTAGEYEVSLLRVRNEYFWSDVFGAGPVSVTMFVTPLAQITNPGESLGVDTLSTILQNDTLGEPFDYTGPESRYTWTLERQGDPDSHPFHFDDTSSLLLEFCDEAECDLPLGIWEVSLTARSDFGEHTVVADDLLTIVPSLRDGGFEEQLVDRRPIPPWDIFGPKGPSSGHYVRGDVENETGGWPRDGSQWCELWTNSTAAARPPEPNRGMPGFENQFPRVDTPSVGGAGVSQLVTYPNVNFAVLEFDASFVHDGTAPIGDWMSVDITALPDDPDKCETRNLFYRDSFSDYSTGFASVVHDGLTITSPERVKVDVTQLFEESIEFGDQLLLTAQVGNWEDEEQNVESYGYFDRVRWTAGEELIVDFGSDEEEDGGFACVIVGNEIGFEDETGTGDTWLWNFGDNSNPSTEQDPKHTYFQTGEYTVSLLVEAGDASGEESKTGYVHVYEQPTASFTGPTEGVIAESTEKTFVADFENTSTVVDPEEGKYEWFFSDTGETIETTAPDTVSHEFKTLGTHTVSLRVFNCKGDADDETGYTEQQIVIRRGFDDVYALVGPSGSGDCTGCHKANASDMKYDFDRTYDVLYTDLVPDQADSNGTRCGASSNRIQRFVTPGDTANSLLYLMITDPPCGPDGAIMGQGGYGDLDATGVELIRQWIATGAACGPVGQCN